MRGMVLSFGWSASVDRSGGGTAGFALRSSGGRLSSWCRLSEGAARESKVAGEGVATERWRGPVSSLARFGAARACSSGIQTRPAGSDTPVSAESAARRDLRVVAPGRGVGSAGDFGPWDCGSCAPCARVGRPSGRSVGSAYRAFPSGESWWVRGSEARQVNSGEANECE
jgi:hypothetical protein